MLDQTSISISPNSELVLDEFIYDPDQNIGKIALSLSKGVMRFVGGKISKNNAVVVQTPSASMSIRGGLALIKVDDLGATEVIHVAGEYTKITSGGKTITPPSYAIVYRLSTLQEETNGKKYFGWTVAKEGFVPTKDVFKTGEAFALAFRQGDVLAAPEGDEPKKLASNDGPERF